MGKRTSTRYPGVQARESEGRKYKGRPDVCYTIDYRDATGKRIRKDVGWASQGFTAVLASEMRAKLINREKTINAMGEIAIPKIEKPYTFGQAWEKYKTDWLVPNQKDLTSPQSLMHTYLKDFKNLYLNEITAYRLDQLMANMKKQGLSTQTIRHAISLVRSVMRRMVKWNLYNGSLPFDNITLPKLNNARERYLTPQEARDLLQELERRSRQTWMMTLVSLHCGLRFGEIARMRWGDIQFEQMTIFIPESKSGRARHAVMTQEVASALGSLPAGHKDSLVFPARNGGVMDAISKAFFRAVNAIGLNNTGETRTGKDGAVEHVKITDARKKVVFHTLRHTYASWLAKSGQGAMIIADRLGHHSLQMTMRYTHLMDASRRESAEAISKLFHEPSPERQ